MTMDDDDSTEAVLWWYVSYSLTVQRSATTIKPLTGEVNKTYLEMHHPD